MSDLINKKQGQVQDAKSVKQQDIPTQDPNLIGSPVSVSGVTLDEAAYNLDQARQALMGNLPKWQENPRNLWDQAVNTAQIGGEAVSKGAFNLVDSPFTAMGTMSRLNADDGTLAKYGEHQENVKELGKLDNDIAIVTGRMPTDTSSPEYAHSQQLLASLNQEKARLQAVNEEMIADPSDYANPNQFQSVYEAANAANRTKAERAAKEGYDRDRLRTMLAGKDHEQFTNQANAGIGDWWNANKGAMELAGTMAGQRAEDSIARAKTKEGDAVDQAQEIGKGLWDTAKDTYHNPAGVAGFITDSLGRMVGAGGSATGLGMSYGNESVNEEVAAAEKEKGSPLDRGEFGRVVATNVAASALDAVVDKSLTKGSFFNVPKQTVKGAAEKLAGKEAAQTIKKTEKAVAQDLRQTAIADLPAKIKNMDEKAFKMYKQAASKSKTPEVRQAFGLSKEKPKLTVKDARNALIKGAVKGTAKLAKPTVEGVAKEGVTEGLQNLLQQYGRTGDVNKLDMASALGDAYVGAMSGGVMEGASSVGNLASDAKQVIDNKKVESLVRKEFSQHKAAEKATQEEQAVKMEAAEKLDPATAIEDALNINAEYNKTLEEVGEGNKHSPEQAKKQLDLIDNIEDKVGTVMARKQLNEKAIEKAEKAGETATVEKLTEENETLQATAAALAETHAALKEDESEWRKVATKDATVEAQKTGSTAAKNSAIANAVREARASQAPEQVFQQVADDDNAPEEVREFARKAAKFVTDAKSRGDANAEILFGTDKNKGIYNYMHNVEKGLRDGSFDWVDKNIGWFSNFYQGHINKRNQLSRALKESAKIGKPVEWRGKQVDAKNSEDVELLGMIRQEVSLMDDAAGFINSAAREFDEAGTVKRAPKDARPQPEAEVGSKTKSQPKKQKKQKKTNQPDKKGKTPKYSTEVDAFIAEAKGVPGAEGLIKNAAQQNRVSALHRKELERLKSKAADGGKGKGGKKGKEPTGVQLPEVNKEYHKKDQAKSDQANKFIGHGVEGSSTDAYRNAWEEAGQANTGDYTADDSIFVSINGGSGQARVDAQTQTLEELDKAIAAGSTIITDVETHRDRKYNTGERLVAEKLTNAGYTENNGKWTKAPASSSSNTSTASQTEVLNDEFSRTVDKNPEDAVNAPGTDLHEELKSIDDELVTTDGVPVEQLQPTKAKEANDKYNITRKLTKLKKIVDGSPVFNKIPNALAMVLGVIGRDATRKQLFKDLGLDINSGQVTTGVAGLRNFTARFLPHLDANFDTPDIETAESRQRIMFGARPLHNFLAKDADGNYYVPRMVRDAVALAAHNTLVASGIHTKNTNAMIKSMLGIDEKSGGVDSSVYRQMRNGVMQSSLTRDMGAEALRNMGYDTTNLQPAELERIEGALGQLAVNTLIDSGLVEQHKVTLVHGGITNNNGYAVEPNRNRGKADKNSARNYFVIRPTATTELDADNNTPLEAIVKASRDSNNLAGLLADGEVSKNSPLVGVKAEEAKASSSIKRNNGGKVPTPMLENATISKTDFYLDAGMTQLVTLLNKAGLLKTFLGYNHDTTNTVKGLTESVEGKNASIDAQVDGISSLLSSMTATGEAKKHGGYSKVPMRFNTFFANNFREMVKSVTFNWQSHKLHRFAVNTTTSTLDFNDSTSMNYFALAIAQAFDFSSDKQLVEKSVENFNQVMTDKDVIAFAKAFNEGKAPSAALLTKLQATYGAGEPAHLLRGLVEASKYLKALEDGESGMQTGIMYEIDGVTNGPYNATVSVGLTDIEPNGKGGYKLSGNLRQRLKQGGLTINGSAETYPQWLSKPGNVDMYQSSANKFTQAYNTIKAGLKNQRDAIKGDAIASLIGDMAKKGRQLFKNPTTVTMYSAGKTSKSNNLILNPIDGVIPTRIYRPLQDELRAATLNEGEITRILGLVDTVLGSNRFTNDWNKLQSVDAKREYLKNFELTHAQEKVFLEVNKKTVGAAVNAVIDEEFATTTRNMQKVTTASDILTAAYLHRYKKEYTKRLNAMRESGELSSYEVLPKAEREAIEFKLKATYPAINTLFTAENGTSDTRVQEGLALFGYNTPTELSPATELRSGVNEGVDGKVSSLEMTNRTFGLGGSSVAPRLTISLDATTMSLAGRADGQSHPNSQMIFDAKLAPLHEIDNTANTLQDGAHQAVLGGYSSVEEISTLVGRNTGNNQSIFMLYKALEGMSANEVSKEFGELQNSLALASKRPRKSGPMSGDEMVAYMKQTVQDLKEINKGLKKGRDVINKSKPISNQMNLPTRTGTQYDEHGGAIEWTRDTDIVEDINKGVSKAAEAIQQTNDGDYDTAIAAEQYKVSRENVLSTTTQIVSPPEQWDGIIGSQTKGIPVGQAVTKLLKAVEEGAFDKQLTGKSKAAYIKILGIMEKAFNGYLGKNLGANVKIFQSDPTARFNAAYKANESALLISPNSMAIGTVVHEMLHVLTQPLIFGEDKVGWLPKDVKKGLDRLKLLFAEYKNIVDAQPAFSTTSLENYAAGTDNQGKPTYGDLDTIDQFNAQLGEFISEALTNVVAIEGLKGVTTRGPNMKSFWQMNFAKLKESLSAVINHLPFMGKKNLPKKLDTTTFYDEIVEALTMTTKLYHAKNDGTDDYLIYSDNSLGHIPFQPQQYQPANIHNLYDDLQHTPSGNVDPQAHEAKMDNIFNNHLAPLFNNVEVAENADTETMENQIAGRKYTLSSSATYNAISAYGFKLSPKGRMNFKVASALIDNVLSLNNQFLHDTQRLYKTAKKQLSWQHMLHEGVTADTANQTQIDEAKRRYDFVFNKQFTSPTYEKKSHYIPDSSTIRHNYQIADFLGLAYADPEFAKALDSVEIKASKTDISTVNGLIEGMANFASSYDNQLVPTIRDGSAGSQIDTFITNAADIMQSYREQAAIAEASEGTFDSAALNAPAEAFNRFLDELFDKPVFNQKNPNMAGKVANTVGNLGRVTVNANNVDLTDELFKVIDGFMKVKNNTEMNIFQSVWNQMRGTNEGNSHIHKLVNYKNKTIDKMRKNVRERIPAVMLQQFKTKPTKEQENAVFKHMLKTDASSMIGSRYDINDVVAFATNPAERTAEIDKLNQELQAVSGNKKVVNYFKNSAKMLGRFMATGVNNSPMLARNAHNIANFHGMDKALPEKHRKLTNKAKAQELVDHLATLHAMGHMPQDSVKHLRALARQELSVKNNGLDFVMKSHGRYKQDVLKRTFSGDPTSMIKGYTKDETSPYRDVVYSTVASEAELTSKGYTRGAMLPTSIVGSNSAPVYMYTTDEGGEVTYLEGIMNNVRKNISGITHSALSNMSKDVKDTGTINSTKALGLLRNNYDSDEEFMAPVFTVAGNVSEWAYHMKEEHKEDLLERNNSFSTSMGLMVSAIDEHDNAEKINKMLVDELAKEYNNAPASEKGKFLRISAKSPNKRLRELWNLTPQSARDYAEQEFGIEGIYVRADLIDAAFGQRKISIADYIATDGPANSHIRKLAQAVTIDIFGPDAVRYMRKGQRGWEEFVSGSKNAILVKSGLVPISNIVSNAMALSLQYGVPVKDATKGMLEQFQALRKYQDDFLELQELEYMNRVGVYKGTPESDRADSEMLRDSLSRNMAKTMHDEGFVTSIIEDVSSERNSYDMRHKVGDFVGDKLDSTLPAPVAKGVKNVFAMHDSATYAFLDSLTRFGDVAAKAVLHDHLLKQGVPRDKAILVTTNAFVNYDLPTHRGIKFLNDMGVMWYTNYFIGMQLPLLIASAKRPLPAAAFGLFQTMTGGVLPNPFSAMMPISSPTDKLGFLGTIIGNYTSHPLLDAI